MRGVLVFGRTGLLARALVRACPDARFLDRAAVDLTRPGAARVAIAALRPRLVLNATAFAAVDTAETARADARAVNTDAPGEMARACAAIGAPFLHVSTDYVFDGAPGRPLTEGDTPRPLNHYGATKLAGEQRVAEAGGTWAILRTAWLFTGDSGFVGAVLRQARAGRNLQIAADQIGAPTPADALAQALLTVGAALCEGAAGGVYHYAGAPDIDRASYARAILDAAGLGGSIDPVTTAARADIARRPLDTRLDCAAILRDFGLTRPDWRAALPRG